MTKAKPDDTRSCQVASGSAQQDSRTLKELSTIWGGTTGQRPELLLEALVQAFWSGAFERDVRLVPDANGDVYQGYTGITAEIQPASPLPDRIAGNYATRFDDGVIVKVGNDDVWRPTAERTEVKIYRDLIARAPDIPDWDGWNEPRAGNKPVPEQVFRDFSVYKLEQWSRTTIENRFEGWRITRRDFAEWYGRWQYAPLANLEKFWPPVADGRQRWHAKPGNELTRHEEAVLSAVKELFPKGEIDHKATHRNTRIKDFLKKSGRGSVGPRTIQRTLKKIAFS